LEDGILGAALKIRENLGPLRISMELKRAAVYLYASSSRMRRSIWLDV